MLSIILGKKLSEKMRENDAEYNRKVPLLVTLVYFAIVMLLLFSSIAPLP